MQRVREQLIAAGQAMEEAYRYVTMAWVLRPAAVCLPESWARMIARIMGLGLALSPFTGRWTYDAFRRSFGPDRKRAFQIAWGWLTRPFLDHVTLLRICHNRETIDDWEIVEHNAEPVRSLLESGQSLVIAIGHFARDATWALYEERILPPFLLGVIAQMPEERTVYGRRLGFQWHTMLRTFDHIRPVDREWIIVGKGLSPLKLLKELQQPGRVVVISIDAPWRDGKRGAFARPFAGHSSRMFATGAARLARLAETSIVSCVLSTDGSKRIVFEWGTPIPPPEASDEAADTRIMNQLLDPLEVAIGARPTQYVLDCGKDRHWNPATRSWEDRA